MFFIPAAIVADVPDITWADAAHNWVFAFLGNLVGAAIFVALGYWYLYGRPQDSQADKGTGDTERTGTMGNGGRAVSDRETTRTGA